MATVDSTRASGLIFDFELIPTVNFVNSGHDALFTYIGEAQLERRSKTTWSGWLYFYSTMLL